MADELRPGLGAAGCRNPYDRHTGDAGPFRVKLEGFWLVVGMAFVAAGFWELWSVETPFAPVILIALGFGLLLWYFTHKLNGRKRMF